MELPDRWLTQARIGADAEVFLNSPLGKIIQAKANREINAATMELIKAEPDDLVTNTRLRRDILRAQDAIEWLVEAVNDGEQARTEIEATQP